MMAVPSSAVTAVYVIGQIVMIAGKDRAHGALFLVGEYEFSRQI
jgi:hypothetical protein